MGEREKSFEDFPLVVSFDPVYDPIFPALPDRPGCASPNQVGHGERENKRRVLRTLKPIKNKLSLFLVGKERDREPLSKVSHWLKGHFGPFVF